MDEKVNQEQHLTVEREKPIQITKRDVIALKLICEQGAMTVEQLWRAVWKAGDSCSQSYAYRRVRDLERNRYLQALSSPLHPLRFLAATAKARDVVRLKEKARVPLMTPPISQLVHVEQLTELRLLVSRRGKVSEWVSERSLLIDPLFPKHRFREHLPDALWVNPAGTRILLEYERARKSAPRVRRKVEAFSREMARIDRFMDHVLWIVEPERLGLFRRVVHGDERQTVRTVDEFQKELGG